MLTLNIDEKKYEFSLKESFFRNELVLLMNGDQLIRIDGNTKEITTIVNHPIFSTRAFLDPI